MPPQPCSRKHLIFCLYTTHQNCMAQRKISRTTLLTPLIPEPIKFTSNHIKSAWKEIYLFKKLTNNNNKKKKTKNQTNPNPHKSKKLKLHENSLSTAHLCCRARLGKPFSSLDLTCPSTTARLGRGWKVPSVKVQRSS